LRVSVNPATTMPYTMAQEVPAYAAVGIRHMELWLDKVDAHVSEHGLDSVRALLTDHGIAPVAACAAGGVMLHDVRSRTDALEDFRRRLEFCRTLVCPILVTVPDFPDQAEQGMYATAERNLRVAGEVAADHGVRLAVEFLQGNRLVATLATAKQLVRGAGHPSVGILLDLSHFWLDRSHVEDIDDLTPDELLLVHLDDMAPGWPELLTDYDRVFPGQGRGIERALVPRIQATGYDGFWSVEIFNRSVWEQPVDWIARETATAIAFVENRYGDRRTSA